MGEAKDTVPGPLTLLQVVVKIPGGLGRPSSLAVPDKVTWDGSVIVWFDPALAVGARFRGLTVIVVSSAPVSALSLAERRRTYVPAAEKPAVVLLAPAFPNVTVPGPLTLLHVVVTAAGGFGRPSSLAVPEMFAKDGKVMFWSKPA